MALLCSQTVDTKPFRSKGSAALFMSGRDVRVDRDLYRQYAGVDRDLYRRYAGVDRDLYRRYADVDS